MELLAGEDKFEVEVKESGCVFKFDFSKVISEVLFSFQKANILLFRFIGTPGWGRSTTG